MYWLRHAVVWLLAMPASAVVLSPGDILVTDASFVDSGGGELLRVDPAEAPTEL